MLKSIAPLMLLATGMLASQTTSLAHDGPDNHFHVLPHDNMRIWTVLDSGSTISGTFVSVREGKAHIRREDGWVRHVKIDRLIAADRLWIESRQLEIVAMNTLPEYVLTGQGGKSAGRSAADGRVAGRAGSAANAPVALAPEQAMRRMKQLEAEMFKRARNLEFEEAARLRDEIEQLKRSAFGLPGARAV